MLTLQISDELSSKLEHRAASAKMSIEAYTQELLEQAIEEADDLDLALEEHRAGGLTYTTEQVRRELGLDG